MFYPINSIIGWVCVHGEMVVKTTEKHPVFFLCVLWWLLIVVISIMCMVNVLLCFCQVVLKVRYM